MNDALRKWLENADGFLRWNRGTIVIDGWIDKQFRERGGDTDRLVVCFEDNGEMTGAIEDYFK